VRGSALCSAGPFMMVAARHASGSRLSVLMRTEVFGGRA
jgi:hypothetical protein